MSVIEWECYSTGITTHRIHTWSTPSGTCSAGHDFSTLTFPATFLRKVLYNDRVSGVSNGERRMDCLRYIELTQGLTNYRQWKGHINESVKVTLTIHQGTTVWYVKNQHHEILWAAYSTEKGQTKKMWSTWRKHTEACTCLHMVPILHHKPIHLVNN